MSYKATAQVIENSPGTDPDTIKLKIISVKPANPLGSVAYIELDNVDINILEATLNSAVIGAVKSYWSLGLLDGVRVF